MAIVVINPNSNQTVTDNLSLALQPLAVAGGPQIFCETLPDGPYGIESQAHIDAVIPLLCDRVSGDDGADAFIIACYSDPGLDECRKATAKPVLGIQECGILTALSRGGQFGVIALSEVSVERHLKYIRKMGVIDRLAKERAAGLSVEKSAEGADTFSILCDVADKLRDEDGANSIILGCAGMAKHRAALEDHLGIPVIDPVQAATSMAVGIVLSRGK